MNSDNLFQMNISKNSINENISRNSINENISRNSMTHYLITRFSVEFEYMRTTNTFDRKRLDSRFHLFKNICYPSVMNQINKNFTWLILIDRKLPNNYIDLLYSIIHKNTKINIKVIEWDVKNSLGNLDWINPNTDNVMTTRLDDDDAMHPNTIDVIQQYYNSPRKYIIEFITFPYGVKTNPYKKTITHFFRPFIAIGLTMITNVKYFPLSIYAFNHQKIVKNNKINYQHIMRNLINRDLIGKISYIYLQPKILMWVYSIHTHSDSGAEIGYIQMDDLNKELNENKKKVFQKFSIQL
jgi:hypothetical protein